MIYSICRKPAAGLLTLLRQKLRDTARGVGKSPQGSCMINTFVRVAILAIVLSTISGVANAKIVECAFDKVTANGMGKTQNTRNFLGESISFDTSKKLINVQWSDRASGWMPAQKIIKNTRFTSYIFFPDIKFESGTVPMKILYRLSADGSGAEVRSEMQKSAGASLEWNQNAARYKCE